MVSTIDEGIILRLICVVACIIGKGCRCYNSITVCLCSGEEYSKNVSIVKGIISTPPGIFYETISIINV